VRPELLGAVLDDAAAVLRNLPGVQEPEDGWPRMADFGQVLAALDVEYGTTALKSYQQITLESELDVIAGHPLADAVLQLASTGPWRGTPTELLSDLTYQREFSREERAGWRTAQEMSQTLNRLSPSLRRAGVEVATGHRSNGKRIIIISDSTR